MGVAVTHFVLLYVLNKTLFISAPSPITECYALIDNGSKNDTWPNNWLRMESTTLDFNRLCKVNLKEGNYPISNAKFRLFFNDYSYVTTDWQELLLDSDSINNTILLWRIVACLFPCILGLLGLTIFCHVKYTINKKYRVRGSEV